MCTVRMACRAFGGHRRGVERGSLNGIRHQMVQQVSTADGCVKLGADARRTPPGLNRACSSKSAVDLSAVVSRYESVLKLGLTAAQRADLIEFLKSL